MITTLGDWIDQRLTGGYIFGPSRFGKSRAVKWYVRSVLEERFHLKLPLVIWVRPPGRRQEAEFWNLLLAASKMHFASLLKPKKKLSARFLFKQQLVTLARSARQNFVLMIIDEAHDVSLDEWKWLLGLQNELDFEGFRLSIFSIGSHQISYRPNYLARTGNTHIAARFFAADAKFSGIRGEDELAYVLNGYDVDSEWPADSQTSFLKYFSPVAYGEGRRLSVHAPDIWQAFKSLLPPEFNSPKLEIDCGIPMQHVALVIEWLLRDLAGGATWDELVAAPSLLRLVARTGFSEHMRKVAMPES